MWGQDFVPNHYSELIWLYLDNLLIVNVQILYGKFPSLYTMYRTEKDRTEAWVLFRKRLKDWATKNQGTVTTLPTTRER